MVEVCHSPLKIDDEEGRVDVKDSTMSAESTPSKRQRTTKDDGPYRPSRDDSGRYYYYYCPPFRKKCVNDEAIMILESTWHVIGTARADCPPYDGLVLQLSYRAV